MAIPDYFGRNAVAASQAISGLDQERLAAALGKVCVGVTIGRDAQDSEGRALADLLVRLLARLYPVLVFRSDGNDGAIPVAQELASRINPQVELAGTPTVEIVVGTSALRRWARKQIFVGSDGWTAGVSTSRAQTCGRTDVPFGPGVAACLAAANLFRHAFLRKPQLDEDAKFSLLDSFGSSVHRGRLRGRLGHLTLAGAGAIGSAAAWALSRVPLPGTLAVVDPQTVDLGNLQRYVLAERSDEGLSKAAVAARYFLGNMTVTVHESDLAGFLEGRDHRVDRLLLALDSARDRRAGQASLPRWIANGWTQPGDLGVSTHDFLGGACVCCLYLPEKVLASEDSILAEAFGVPDRLMQIRALLHRNEGAPRELLEAIAVARSVLLDRLLPFEGRSLRTLYTEGFCGGAVIPLGQGGVPRADVHVPLAHQSALAGVLLAAVAVGYALGESKGSYITQVNVMRPLQALRTRPVAKDPRGICICQDPDYQGAYRRKFPAITQPKRLRGRLRRALTKNASKRTRP